ncbi:hypothetical protein [Streptomyces swartbergensis]|uniref:hypothetical protein n=1 Tax=Streptomyces swartbergensis TaxID=487165 RepID=UPI0038231C6A
MRGLSAPIAGQSPAHLIAGPGGHVERVADAPSHRCPPATQVPLDLRLVNPLDEGGIAAVEDSSAFWASVSKVETACSTAVSRTPRIRTSITHSVQFAPTVTAVSSANGSRMGHPLPRTPDAAGPALQVGPGLL